MHVISSSKEKKTNENTVSPSKAVVAVLVNAIVFTSGPNRQYSVMRLLNKIHSFESTIALQRSCKRMFQKFCESMKRDANANETATRLKEKLRAAIGTLNHKESPALISHILHDVAHLTSACGERSLRQQYEEIINLAKESGPRPTRERTEQYCETKCNTWVGDWGRMSSDNDPESDSFHTANRDLMSKMNHMKGILSQMEEQHRSEVEELQVELERYKELLADSERKLIKERILNEKLRSRNKLGHCRSVDGNFGFGALTVRSCGSRETSRSRCSPCSTCHS
jgi:hypothetical protein